MAEITEKSRMPFGREKGKRLGECSDAFLQWMVDHLIDTDWHAYAYQAQRVLLQREQDGRSDGVGGFDGADLEAQVDALLRNAGYSDLCLKKRPKRR